MGAEDSEVLEKQFAPTFTPSDLMNIDNRNALVRLLVNGKPAKPFNIEINAPEIGDLENIEKIKNLSYSKYGKDRKEVEDLILEKYKVL